MNRDKPSNYKINKTKREQRKQKEEIDKIIDKVQKNTVIEKKKISQEITVIHPIE